MNKIGIIAKTAVRRCVNAVGYDIVRYDHNNARTRLARLLLRHHIGMVLDVGANRGDFGWNIRELGYRGKIVSFEPLQEPFLCLQSATRDDPVWQAVNVGLGNYNERRVIHVAANSQSSSLLPMLDTHVQAAPESRYDGEELVTIRRLDDIVKDYRRSDEAIFLKVDAQGFERNIIVGARETLSVVPLVQLECSFIALYEGGDLVESLIERMRELGYDPIDTFPVFYHRGNGHLMQPDILFLRRDSASLYQQ